MPSKGTPVRTFRCQDDLWDEAIETVERRNMWSRETAWTMSEFIGIAIKEKIAKMGRGRKVIVDTDERLPDPFIGK